MNNEVFEGCTPDNDSNMCSDALIFVLKVSLMCYPNDNFYSAVNNTSVDMLDVAINRETETECTDELTPISSGHTLLLSQKNLRHSEKRPKKYGLVKRSRFLGWNKRPTPKVPVQFNSKVKSPVCSNMLGKCKHNKRKVRISTGHQSVTKRFIMGTFNHRKKVNIQYRLISQPIMGSCNHRKK